MTPSPHSVQSPHLLAELAVGSVHTGDGGRVLAITCCLGLVPPPQSSGPTPFSLSLCPQQTPDLAAAGQLHSWPRGHSGPHS